MFLLVFPGINLLNAVIKGVILKKSIMADPQVKDAIVPMTDEEKEQYAKIKGKIEKCAFTTFIHEKEDEEKFSGILGKKSVVADHGLTTLCFEELMPLNYTLDEVKKLSEATTFSYKIGKIDGKNVEVIGVSNPDSPVSRILLKAEGFNVKHTYEQMTEEEAKDRTFTVYPSIIPEDTKENLEKVIEEIKQSRIDRAAEVNLEALQLQSNFRQDYILMEAEEDTTETQHGIVLKKSFSQERK